ncbi:MAG: SDR family oxidoreductase, partial [Pirellulales bacterium]|nr:SDR family oxidoreductase [Pirellulales bacterium]
MIFCNLSGKNILITGASSGIGKQAAINISKQGGIVIITGRNQNRLNATFKKLEGKGHQSFVADLTDENQINDLVKIIPKLNGIVHCAGIVLPMPAKFIRQENISKMIRVHFEIPVLLNAR